MKSRKDVLEEMHDEILRSAVESEIALRIVKGKKPDEVIETKKEITRMGPITRTVTAADYGEQETKKLEKNITALKVIESAIITEAEKEKREDPEVLKQ